MPKFFKEQINLSKKNRVRIYVDTSLQIDGNITCDEKQSHYLLNVMRLSEGDEVFVFNGKDGEFCCKVESAQKKKCVLRVSSKFCDFVQQADFWLLFAPLKKDNTDFVVEKATELGVRKIVPIISEYTSNTKVRIDRLKMQVIEAAEQSRRQDIPEINQVTELKKLLANWDEKRKLIYLDESLKSQTAIEQIPKCHAPVAILVGPEGGFSEKELEILRKKEYAYGVSLGKTILRAETAAIAALACWQAISGDWQ